MSLKRTKNSASAGKSPATESSSAQAVATNTGATERKAEINRTISEAMTALSARKTMDWARDTPEISAAQDRLDNAMADFIAGTATREQVKRAYRAYADLHIV